MNNEVRIAGETRLFPDSDCFVHGHPAQSGFMELRLPDTYRWILEEARCLLLKPKAITDKSRFVLMITANNIPQLGVSCLTIEVNGANIGQKAISSFGHFYFDVKSDILKAFDEIQIVLKVTGRTLKENTNLLAMPIYCVKLIDVEADLAEFDERNLFIGQVKVFRPDECMLSKILEDKKLGSESKILDIGAGVGWTTVLLAARTGAYATAIDSNHYTNTRSIKSDLLDMFFRNLSVLRREPEFNAIMTRADIAEVIDRCFFINMSAMDMHFEDNTFDFVFSLNAFEHIPDPAIAIKELHRVLKPGGEGYIQFHPLYYSDDGSHLHACALLDKPWVHLLYDRDQIRKMIIEAGKVPNEIDNILDSLNGWSARQFHDLFSKSGLRIINKNVYKGFTIQGSEKSDQFLMLKKQFPEEELTTIGMTLHLMKRQI